MPDPRDRGVRLGWLSIALVVCLAAPCLAVEFYVTTTADTNDGVCPSASQCSLRDAILVANSRLGHDTIYLPAGNYVLTRAGVDEDESATGDLDITDDVDIFGDGATVTVVDGNRLDRVFHVHSGTAVSTVRLDGMTIRGGDLEHVNNTFGAGLRAEPCTLYIVGCIIEDNVGPSNPGQTIGGGIDIYGDGGEWAILHVEHTTIRNNSASWSGALSARQTLVFIQWSTISGNSVDNPPSAASFADSQVSITNSTVVDNDTNSGAAFMMGNSTVEIESCTFSNFPSNFDAPTAAEGVTLRNTIIEGGCLGDYYTTLGGNIEGPGDTCHLENPGDYFNSPMEFMPLGYYGGPTPTMPPVGQTATLVVDNPWADGNCQPDDQRGFTRPQDGDGDGLAVCDSGAVEYHGLVFDDGFESGDTTRWSTTVN